jgi:hypothetical protein
MLNSLIMNYTLGRISPISNPSRIINGLMEILGQSGSQTWQFKAYNTNQLTEKITKVTFTKDQPVGSPPQAGTLGCFLDTPKTICSFELLDSKTVPGIFQLNILVFT